MVIPISLLVVALVCLGFSIFFYKKYKATRKITFLIYFFLLIGLFLTLFQVGIKYVSPRAHYETNRTTSYNLDPRSQYINSTNVNS